ncbi:hypothetical protein H2201_003801 [Coniosporium apollinis]|uniref:Sugar phosphate transporter domain-containing protein n=1 Tax=Coniosporium apollinis TaxID=61459 RepID=A0ABQ9NWJ3_9PEZI|nr:hypothetical protein H2201_003801 [Coniosporium apollinis]
MASTTLTVMEAQSPATATEMFKFPAFQPDYLPTHHEEGFGQATSRASSPGHAGSIPNGTAHGEQWQPRKETRAGWAIGRAPVGAPVGGTRHERQKSLSEAIRTIRTRHESVSASAHEIADALKAPVSPKLILLCGIWYATSILSNTSSKAILTALPRPVTLTLVQFAFVSSWCIFLAWLSRLYPRLKTAIPALKYGIRPPSRDLILTTLPLTAFQIGGHILSSDAMSRIPVSLVHTIKGLSPLLTVLAYRFFFGIRYSGATYLSLIPLTLGVIMACSANFSGNFIGLLCAFGSALLFVTQNIVSKKLFNEAAQAEADGRHGIKNRKPDKLNLLCYSSGLAFLLTAPLWLWSEGFTLIADFLHDASVDLSGRPGSLDHGRLVLEFIFNGTFHFGQNLVAFVLLSMVSPVTYSVASLIKRVFVISFAIVWFGNKMTTFQGVGIGLTFLGLYLYDRVSDAAKADRRARMLQTQSRDALLPLTTDNLGGAAGFVQSPAVMTAPQPYANGYLHHSLHGLEKRSDDAGPGRPRNGSPTGGGWLPPGTKQEATWTDRDISISPGVPAS